MALLARYLEGLREDGRELWIGYRYISNGSLVTADGEAAPFMEDVFVSAGLGGGEDEECVGVRGGEIFSAPCNRSLSFLCEYNYSGMHNVNS